MLADNISVMSSNQILMLHEVGRYASNVGNDILQAIGGLSQLIDNQLMEIVSAIDKRFNKMDEVFCIINGYFNTIDNSSSFQIVNNNY